MARWLQGAAAATLALVAFLVAPSIAVAALVNPIALFNDHRESVVRIVTVNGSGQMRVGCGIVLLESGTIATAHELFKNVAGARVELADGTVHDQVTMLATDGVVAIVKVEATRLRRLKLADSSGFPSAANPSVIVLGGPSSAGRMLVGGHVNSVVRRSASGTEAARVIQVLLDAPLFVENWGAPVFTDQGSAIGIVTPRMTSAPGDTRHGVTPSHIVGELLAQAAAATPAAPFPSLPSMSSRAPQRPEKEVIAAARTVSVFVAFGPEELKSELTNELAKSFPWQAVDADAHADLVLLVSAMGKTRARYRVINGVRDVTPVDRSVRYEVSASLRERGTYNELWSSRKSVDADAATPYDEVSGRIAAAMRKSIGALADVAPGGQLQTATPPAPVLSDPSSVLPIADLPEGFRLLSPAEVQKLGMTAEQQAASFRNWSEDAKVVGHAVFVDPRKPHFVVVSIMAPISTLAAAGFHLQAAYPDAMIKGMNAGGQARDGTGRAPAVLLPGLDAFGDRSIGFTRVQTSGATSLREDVVLAMRGATLEVVHSIYPQGSQPAVDIAAVMKIVDAKVRAAPQ